MMQQRRDQGCAKRREGHEHDHADGHHGYPVRTQPAPGQGPLAAALDRLFWRRLDALRDECDLGGAHGDSLRPALAAVSPAPTGKWPPAKFALPSPTLTSRAGPR